MIPAAGPIARLIAIAETAGVAAMRFYQTDVAVVRKADDSPLTSADAAAHESIVGSLAAWDSSIPVISEESTLPAYEERRHWRRFWLVDPLDGTKEFLARNGEFTVNIALIEDGEPVLGVINAPATGTIYAAERGSGAWRHAAGVTERICGAGPRPPGAAVRVVESRSHPSRELDEYIATLGPVERIQLGSSLKFCRLAEGAADLYPRFGPTMEWDVAAGDCIYRNATLDGAPRPSPLRYNQPSLRTAQFVVGEVLRQDPVRRSG